MAATLRTNDLVTFVHATSDDVDVTRMAVMPDGKTLCNRTQFHQSLEEVSVCVEILVQIKYLYKFFFFFS